MPQVIARAGWVRNRHWPRPTTPAMTWWTIGPGCGVLEFDYTSPDPTAIGGAKPEVLGLELLVWWGGGEPTRAVWFWSQTGRVMGWAGVGET